MSPPLKGRLSLKRPIQSAVSLLTDPAYFWTLAILIIIGDVVLTRLIIGFVSYTEIDWETYMIQTELYLKGQHNYSMIEGPTGPLVYPAGHLYIHSFLHDITDAGRNIALAQHIYGVLYVATLVLTCAIYFKAGTVPNWILLLLPLSKRLHSIFVLRLFNDCWAVLAVQGAILLYQMGLDDTATFLFSAALSVKMSVLLYIPGLLVILFKRRGLISTLRHMMTILAIQTLMANPFLAVDPWAYFNCAFDLRRVFLYKWTVNWRMVNEEVFLSRNWAVGLLVGHGLVLVLFGLFRWCKVDGGVWSVLARGLSQPTRPAAGPAPITADCFPLDIATVLFTSNLIGILFSRSLHYQFYSWYAHQIPFLAWKSPYPSIFKILILIGIEYAWNVFPSTPLSSSVLLSGNALLLYLYRDFYHSNSLRRPYLLGLIEWKLQERQRDSPPSTPRPKKRKLMPETTSSRASSSASPSKPKKVKAASSHLFTTIPTSDAEEDELVDPSNAQKEPSPDDLVDCPLCNKRVKFNRINEHMDKGCKDTPPISNRSSASDWKKLMAKPSNTKGKQKDRVDDNEDDEYPLPKAAYSTLKDKRLKEMLVEYGLPTSGDRPQWIQRHQRWVILYNSNLDKALLHRKSKDDLLKDLKKWEDEKSKRKKTTVQDTAAHEKQHRDEFARLVEAAKPKPRANIAEDSTSTAAKELPSARSSSDVSTTQAAQIDIVVDSEEEEL
ncbi:hypothetical protein H0H92_007989 [Tricholoma furcatifolium]|nr:hypothetical protein H0H92_007989 [Tricholoma furcatifolium]